ncbi:hypothetical protein BDZ91DRAFT_763475 [Kalaharituber pfeilii]|nr:hypothetical protein BDZ91DRAFT_763475 [Kalaharituber pfeilii]
MVTTNTSTSSTDIAYDDSLLPLSDEAAHLVDQLWKYLECQCIVTNIYVLRDVPGDPVPIHWFPFDITEPGLQLPLDLLNRLTCKLVRHWLQLGVTDMRQLSDENVSVIRRMVDEDVARLVEEAGFHRRPRPLPSLAQIYAFNELLDKAVSVLEAKGIVNVVLQDSVDDATRGSCSGGREYYWHPEQRPDISVRVSIDLAGRIAGRITKEWMDVGVREIQELTKVHLGRTRVIADEEVVKGMFEGLVGFKSTVKPVMLDTVGTRGFYPITHVLRFEWSCKMRGALVAWDAVEDSMIVGTIQAQ